MSPKQTKFYWQMWRVVSSARPGLDRHEWHERVLGRPTSSKAFTQEDFDALKADFLSITKPASVPAQMRQLEMPQIRARKAIEFVAAAMDRDDAWLEAIVARANRERRLSTRTAATFDDLTPDQLERVLYMVKDQAARTWRVQQAVGGGRWNRKDPLLEAMREWFRENEIDRQWAVEIAAKALCIPKLLLSGPRRAPRPQLVERNGSVEVADAPAPSIDSLRWDDLLIVFGAWKLGLRGAFSLTPTDFEPSPEVSSDAVASPDPDLIPF